MLSALKGYLGISATALVLSLSSSAYADSPSNVQVRSISYAGSGCPAGTVANNVSPDAQAFTLLFDSYVAEAGPGVPFNQKRKNCQLVVGIDVPQGWSYTLFTVDTRGYMSLEPGVQALEQSTYYFQGERLQATLRTPKYGPMDGNYNVRDTLPVEALVWSPCGASRAININTEVRVNNAQNPQGHGLATVDSIDGKFELQFGLQWRRCF